MAQLWVRDHGGPWQPRPLGAGATEIGGARQAMVMSVDAAGARAWAIMSAPEVPLVVAGIPIPAGIAQLDDRDEIRLGGRTFFFSTESLAHIENFPGSDRPVFCGRCRQPIEAGAPAVRCPSCGVWYNQSADLPCWTYADKCTFCSQPTALDAGFNWTPEE